MLKTTVVDSALDRLVAWEVAGLVLLPQHGPRLYYRRVGDAFSLESSVTGTLVGVDAAATLGFELPHGAVDFLRFDLPAVPGCYRMGPVAIGGREIENLSRRVMAVHGRRLPDPDSASEIRLVEWRDAPNFELDVRDLLGDAAQAGTVSVRVGIRKEHAAIEMERRLDAAVETSLGQMHELGDAIHSTVVETAASLSLAQRTAENHLHQTVAETNARVDRLAAKVDGAASASNERLERHSHDVATRMTAQEETLKQELTTLRATVDSMRGQLDFLVQYEINRSLVRRALRKLKRTLWK